MVYTDMLFLFAFLPIVTVIMMVLSEPWEKNLAAIIASLVLIVWARPIYYILIILPVAVVYFAARLYEKTKNRFVYISSLVISVAFGGGLALACSTDNSLKGAVSAVGFLLFALRSFTYLDDVRRGAPAEKDLTALGAYLISYEFILISPVKSYGELGSALKERRFKLSNLATGMRNFVFGLAKVAILGLSFDRVRLAALDSETTPWVNAIIGLLAAIIEAYIVLDGYTQMSGGLATANGVAVLPTGVGIRPRASILRHVGDVYEGFGESISRYFGGSVKANLFGLAVSSLLAGAAIALESGAVAFVGIITAGLIICAAPSADEESGTNTGVFECIISVILTAAGFLLLANGSASGVAGWFASLNPNNHEFDISYALYDELTRAIPWLVIGVVSITPLPEMFAGIFRARMSENEKFYSVARAAGTCVCVALLVISVIALVSAGR